MSKKRLVFAGAFLVALGALFIPIEGKAPAATGPTAKASALDLSGFSSAPPGAPLDLLFIHHSVGGQLLTDPGPEKEKASCVYEAHPNGGGLRRKLTEQGYRVHEASYGSEIGEDTDLFHWAPKFRDKMDKLLRVALNDEVLPEGEVNRIVVFKSCYPNNRFRGEGTAPGNPAGPELTVWNAKAALTSLLPELAKRKDTLFVYLTAPANVLKRSTEPAWKWTAKRILGKPTDEEIAQRQADLARSFNNWVKSPDGWLSGYPEKNVVVFDYYDVLTNRGESNFSLHGSQGNTDNHPSSEGNARAADELVPFINRAVRRAGLVP
ncbi:hypothetical protein WMF31_31875 [Sorangium sp. So ce1036]|uniref:hypothetical protein n=1 Tax=Sorangium sp. So ce1036 TaxID=3133328 RepID=UPI003F0BD246